MVSGETSLRKDATAATSTFGLSPAKGSVTSVLLRRLYGERYALSALPAMVLCWLWRENYLHVGKKKRLPFLGHPSPLSPALYVRRLQTSLQIVNLSKDDGLPVLTMISRQ